MKTILAFVRPHKLEEVKSALALLPISGMTIRDARGTGDNPEEPVTFMGQAMVVTMPMRSAVEVVVPDDLAEDVISAIKEAAWTGAPGDGKIFIEPVVEAIRVRTLERGDDAL